MERNWEEEGERTGNLYWERARLQCLREPDTNVKVGLYGDGCMVRIPCVYMRDTGPCHVTLSRCLSFTGGMATD